MAFLIRPTRRAHMDLLPDHMSPLVYHKTFITAPYFMYHLHQNKSIVKLLVLKGANINARNNYGLTPLYMALRLFRSPDACQTLIESGADCNVQREHGFTLLDLAIRYN